MSVPRIHVDENGNIRKGAPTSLPPVISGAFQTTGNAPPYLNYVGNESQIQSPPSGGNIITNPKLSRNGEYDVNAVDQGQHFGHVLNDDNGELDERELQGISQIPAQALFNLVYAPHSGDGSLFTTQLPPPPGAPVSRRAAAGPGLPRAPGGGVAPRLGSYSYAERNLQKAADPVSVYDESLPNPKRGIAASADIHKANLLARAGVGNPLEMSNPQAQHVLRMEKRRDMAADHRKNKMPGVGHRGISKKKHSKKHSRR